MARTPSRNDWLLTGSLLALALFAVFIPHDLVPDKVESALPVWGDYLFTAALILPLAWRRRFPLTVGVAVGVGFALYRLVQVPEGSVSSAVVFIALFAMGAYGADARRRNAWRAAAVTASFLALAWSIYRDLDFVSFDGFAVTTLSLGLNVLFFTAAWMLGDSWRQRQEYAVELELRADELAHQREERARQAVTEERVRIARELHDVVAHHVSVMGVQAAGARRILESDPSRATAALESVEESGRSAVSELQRLVGFLRDDTDGVDAAPQPTLDGLEALVATTRDAGVQAEVLRVGRPRQVPSSVELSAYRIVQEALTNVIKYAPGAATSIVLTYQDAALGVEVVNQAPPTASTAAPGGGRGMVGMRERAAMLGGTFEFGPVSGRGFRVAAVLPTGTSYDAEADAS
ncbi:MAG: sensor histidine kinase [Acidimicrobiia bacterium]|nr:sensor histidine kinase [Acidimicrobiia bacterium]